VKLLASLLALLLALPLTPALAAETAVAAATHTVAADYEPTSSIIPRYLLQDPYGRPVSNEDFRGRFQLIAFGYTYCPDICPTTLVEMAEILKTLGAKASRLQAIFITVDPERDTGKVLKTYTEFFDPRILGLTGSPLLVRRAADNFRIRYAKVQEPGASAGPYAVDHSAGMILLGPDGQVIRKFAFATPVAELSARIASYISER
jgi:protein SCO1/2